MPAAVCCSFWRRRSASIREWHAPARGAKGRWYKDVAGGGEATVEFNGHKLPVRAVPAADQASIEQATREYLRKYGRSPYAQSVVRPDILPTTLRLEPR